MDQISSENLKWSVWGLSAKPWGRCTTMLLLLIGLESCEMIETLKYRFNTNPGGSFALPQTQASHALNHAAVKQYLNTNQLIEKNETGLLYLSPPWSRSPPSSLCSILNSASSNSFCLWITNTIATFCHKKNFEVQTT